MIEILMVDDHAMFREGLKQILAKHGDLRITDEVGNGEDALEKVRSRAYGIVILDISMPGQSGWEVLNEIRLHKPHLPVLVLSMLPEDQFALRMLKAGASGYVSKESAAEELITAIRKVAAGGRYISGTLAEKMAFAIDVGADKPPHQLLSNREFEVMCMLASGKALKEIAGLLRLSEKTITTYRARILEKMHLRNNAELTRYALQHQLLV